MLSFKIELADLVVEVTVSYPSTKCFLAKYLSKKEADFSVTVETEDVAHERACAQTEDAFKADTIRDLTDEYLETLALYRKIVTKAAKYGVLLMHGSAIAVDGKAYIFTAESGTGKSTHTRLWRELLGEKAVMINDDKPLIRLKDGNVKVYGSAWNGKHRLGSNTCADLSAICILNRGETNTIGKIEDAKSVFPYMLQQTFRPKDRENMIKTVELLDNLLEKVNVYELHCNMEIDAAVVSYGFMAANDEK